MADLLISVILPTFNAASTVRRAVQSIRNQTLHAWELIVVDDGSTDNTESLLRAMAREEPRLRVIARPHAGIVSALNEGLKHVQAPLIARMDADDEALPRRLERQVAFLANWPDVGVLGSLVEFGGDPSAAGGYALHVAWMNSLVTPEEIALNRFVESPFAHPSVVFRRELVGRFGAYREGNFPEDYELWLRWLDADVTMSKLPEVLLRWQDSAGRLSRNDPRYGAEGFYRCKASYLARWLARRVDCRRRLFVWGAGRPTRKRADYLCAHGVRIAGYIDIDPAKIGRNIAGRTVLAPSDLPAPETSFVLCYVAKRGARELARAQLGARGFIEGRDFIVAA